MSCCSGNNRSNKKVKEWGNEESQNQIALRQKSILIVPVLLLIAFIIYKFILT